MKIKDLYLETKSIALIKSFYKDVLELHVRETQSGYFCVELGNTAIHFIEKPDTCAFYHFAFNITNNRFHDCYKWLKSKIEILDIEPGEQIGGFPDWNAASFYFHDPAGNILEVIVRYNLQYHSDDDFSIKDLKEVSEIGIVTSNVSGTARQLIELYNVPYFYGGPRHDEFTTLGDDYGLLLIASEGRGWKPTNRPSIISPLRVHMDNGKIFTVK